VAIRKSLFPLLVAFALLTSQISAAYIVFVPLAILWIVVASREGRLAETLSSAPAALVILQGLAIVLSTVFSRDPATSARHLAGVSLLLLLPIAMDLYREPFQPRAVLLALGLSGVALSLDGFWQFAHGGNDLDNRIRATLSHWMTFSGLTMIAGCVLLGFAFEGRGRWRWVGLGAVVPLGAMLLTFTRNAYVGTLVGIALYLLLRRPRGLILLPLALTAIFLLSPRSIQARIRSIASLEDVTNRDRISMLHAGARMIADDPFFGVGPEMVKVYYPRYRDPDATEQRAGHLHNNILQLAAANGLIAAALYTALMALFFARTGVLLRRESRPDQAALLAGALMAGAALFVAGFFEYNWGDTEVEMATLLVLAVPFSRACAPELSGVSSTLSAVQRTRSSPADG
jgi:O-antigen ligase